jgi:hypothetical protein
MADELEEAARAELDHLATTPATLRSQHAPQEARR